MGRNLQPVGLLSGHGASGLIQLLSAIVGYWRPSAHTNVHRMNNKERGRETGRV